jgi:hypothetical protein
LWPLFLDTQLSFPYTSPTKKHVLIKKQIISDAYYNKDGQVALGERISFLAEQVRRETRNTQIPTVAGNFDPDLSIGK